MTEKTAFPGLATGYAAQEFEFFREGVEICHLRREDPAVALLRYAPGARVPRHRHAGLETILVLEGTQSDERGSYGTGSLILNPEGTEHSVWSEPGCVVLIQWERPVEILGD
ncbi:cupin domain-containing protein [Mangrovicoccus sp. HB161399]|uniref:cupin domain-containing protein n=1 Tax=Mangrovicoccus sp. HB161399 TaxID=2720392 RepID=UPI001552FF27|nr:cupin domain-containing protein [Mangrovicoccus sp. HB161399]